VPLAKITGLLALLALVSSVGQLFLAAAMSPVWRGGVVCTTLECKGAFDYHRDIHRGEYDKRLRRLILVQTASVSIICLALLLLS
jgi:hypothetical protein